MAKYERWSYKEPPNATIQSIWSTEANDKFFEDKHREYIYKKYKYKCNIILDMPYFWSKPSNDIKTLKDLYNKRRQLKLPSASYDFTGDGSISPNKYFIARRFDTNNDLKLEDNEKKLPLSALKNDYKSKFIWDLEKCGHLRGARILQIRGEMVDAENYLDIGKSYPSHVISTQELEHKTTEELRKRRKKDLLYIICIKYRSKLKNQKEEWGKLKPNTILQKSIHSEFLVEDPK